MREMKRLVTPGSWTLFTQDVCPQLYHLTAKLYNNKYIYLLNNNSLTIFFSLCVRSKMKRVMTTMTRETSTPRSI